MSVTSQIYWYYIDYGSGFVLSELHENKLSFNYILDEEHEGNVHKELEGSFELHGTEFDLLKTNFEGTGNTDIPFRIYEHGNSSTGTLIWDGVFTVFNKFDDNKSVVEVKDFELDTIAKRIIDVIDNSVSIRTSVYKYYGDDTHRTDMFCNLLYSGQKITEFAYTTADVINSILEYVLEEGDDPIHIDTSDAWADTAAIDITKLKFFELRAYICDGAGTILAGTPSKMSLQILFDIFKVFFRSYWYVDESVSPPHLKFKTPSDFVSNTLNLVDEFTHKQIDNYNFKQNYRQERFSLHDNNYLNDADVDNTSSFCKVVYIRMSSVSLEYPMIPIQTRYTRGTTDSLNTDGWFLGYVNTSTNVIETEEGFVSGSTSDNNKLCHGNLTRTYYQDYIYTDKVNYTNCAVAPDADPVHIKPFVQLPEVSTVLASVANFYDSLIYKIDSNYQYIARVYEQRTDLKTNNTTFVSYKFTKIAE